MRFPLSVAVLSLLLAGCVVGPDHKRPEVAGAAAAWTQEVAAGPFDLEPWRAMGDPVLVGLIEKAVAANLDLRIAEARLREARAARDAAAGGRLPQAGATAEVSQRRLSENGVIPITRLPGVARNFSLYDVGFDASWEIDLWGGNSRNVESATRRVEAADAQRREAQLRVVAEVAREYAELRGAQAQAAIRTAEADANRQRFALMRQLAEAGEVAQSNYAYAEVQARQAEASLAAIEPRVRQAASRLAVLTAQPPEAMDEVLTPAAVPALPGPVAAGLRSELLQRRPDVIAAEAELAAATAQIGVEKARLFPKLSLVGNFGVQDRGGSDLFSGDSTYLAAGPGLSWPIFSAGRIRAQVRAASARAEAAEAAYEKSVLGAFADSEAAINRYSGALAAAKAFEQASAKSANALALAQSRFRQGESSKLELIDAILGDHSVRFAAAEARTEALKAHAALIKALGGGWKQ